MKSSLRAVLLIIVEYWALSEHSVFVHAYTAYSLGGHFRQPNLMSFPIFMTIPFRCAPRHQRE